MVNPIVVDFQICLPHRDTEVKPAGSLEGLEKFSSESALGEHSFCP